MTESTLTSHAPEPLQLKAPLLFERLAGWRTEVVTAVALLVLPWQRTFIGDFRVDDAYITFEFSRNLAAGNGPVYGAGQRVEGYSNFLWMVLACPAEFVGVDIVVWARLLTWFSFAVLVWTACKAVSREGGWLSSVLVATCLVATTALAQAAQSALETVPFAAAVTLTLVLSAATEPRHRRWAGLAAALCGLLRIDGFLVLFYVTALYAADLLTGDRRALRERALTLAPGYALLVAYWVFRVAYYGHWLPSTVRAKELISSLNPDRGLDYLFDAIQALGLLPMLILAGGAVAARQSKLRVALAGFVVCHAIYTVRVGGDWMPFWRFLLPLLAPVLILAALGAEEALTLARARGRNAATATAVLLATAGSFYALHADAHTIQTRAERAQLDLAAHVKRHARSLRDATGHVAAMIRSPSDVLVTDYGGFFAYYVRAHIIEQWGLSNWEIASRGNTNGVASIYGKTCIECYRDFGVDYLYAQPSPGELLVSGDPYGSRDAVIRTVFQGEALRGVLELPTRFVVGRVRGPDGRGLYFLERKRPERPRTTRQVGAFTVDYPYGDQ